MKENNLSDQQLIELINSEECYQIPLHDGQYGKESVPTDVKIPESFDFNRYLMTDKLLNKRIHRTYRLCRVGVSHLKSILVAISSCCAGGWATRAGQKLIAERAGVSIATVKRAVKGLRATGVLKTYHNYKLVRGFKRRITSTTIISVLVHHFKWLAKSLKPAPSSISITVIPLLHTNTTPQTNPPQFYQKKPPKEQSTAEWLADYRMATT